MLSVLSCFNSTHRRFVYTVLILSQVYCFASNSFPLVILWRFTWVSITVTVSLKYVIRTVSDIVNTRFSAITTASGLNSAHPVSRPSLHELRDLFCPPLLWQWFSVYRHRVGKRNSHIRANLFRLSSYEDSLPSQSPQTQGIVLHDLNDAYFHWSM